MKQTLPLPEITPNRPKEHSSLIEQFRSSSNALLKQLEAASGTDYETIARDITTFVHKIELLLITGYPEVMDDVCSFLESVQSTDQKVAINLRSAQFSLTQQQEYKRSSDLFRVISRLLQNNSALQEELFSPIGRLTLERFSDIFSPKTSGHDDTIGKLSANRVLKTRALTTIRVHSLENLISLNERAALGLEVNDLSCTMMSWEDYQKAPSCSDDEYNGFEERFLKLTQWAGNLTGQLNKLGRENVGNIDKKGENYTNWCKEFVQFQSNWLTFQFDCYGKVA